MNCRITLSQFEIPLRVCDELLMIALSFLNPHVQPLHPHTTELQMYHIILMDYCQKPWLSEWPKLHNIVETYVQSNLRGDFLLPFVSIPF